MCPRSRTSPSDTLQIGQLYTAADMEGHVGEDGRYYSCDFSRLFPPEDPRVEAGSWLVPKVDIRTVASKCFTSFPSL
jgi:hypothetical protein